MEIATQISARPSAAVAAVHAADLSDKTKRRYIALLTQFEHGGGRLTDAAAVRNFAQELTSDSARRQFRAAIGVYGRELALQLKSAAHPTTAAETQAALWRIDAMTQAFSVPETAGETAHRWLTPVEQRHLLMLPDLATLKGRRDNVLLRLLLGCGLRRNEAAHLTYDAIKLLGDQTVLELTAGTKRGKRRLVPVGRKLAGLLTEWGKETGSGCIVRNVHGGQLGESITGTSIARIVKGYGRALDVPDLAPHDLRRTFAENLRQNGADLVDVQTQLGHAKLETTRRYLNIDAALRIAGSDFLPW